MTTANTWAGAIFRNGAGIIKWKVNELKKLNRKSRKTMTIHGAFHQKSDIHRLYVKRSEGGRGLISIERCIRQEENTLKVYMANSEENRMKGVCRLGRLEAEEISPLTTIRTGSTDFSEIS